MKKGDKVLVECLVKRLDLYGANSSSYNLVLADDCIADTEAFDFWAPAALVRPIPEYQNGEIVDVRTTEHDSPKPMRYAGYIDGKHYCYPLQGDSPLSLYHYVRPMPKKVTVEIDAKLMEKAKSYSEHGKMPFTDFEKELCQAIVDGKVE